MEISSYNEYLKLDGVDDGKYLIYNSLTNGLGEIKKDLYDALVNKDFSHLIHCEELEHLIQGQFIYMHPIDELETMEKLFTATRYQKHTLHLTILPTFNCNFRCSYCFENLTEKSGNRSFTTQVQQDILNYVQTSMEASDLKHVVVNWTGGEPLLEFKKVTLLMEKMNAMAAEKHIEVSHDMVSNGYLLTRRRAAVLRDLGLKNIQITIDGNKSNHDKRRVLENRQGTFDQIIENIRETCDLIHISIRSNVDLHNVDSLEEYMDYIMQQDFQEKVSIYFSATTDYVAGGCSSSGSCFANQEFSGIILSLYEKALRKGLNISYYPQYAPVICAAIAANSIVVQPDGWIQKCWNTVGNPKYTIGHISNLINSDQRAEKWLDYSPYKVEKCRSCSVLPLCGGGCAQQAFESNDKQPVCCEYKYNLNEMLRFNYYRLEL
ncbi:radical SAM protein [Paenibacillus sp. S29]|uniref:radical SAM protein n=1 Tax=Paenibacillus sp. S29 TaxID=3394611 RepID=UPI0039BF79BE